MKNNNIFKFIYWAIIPIFIGAILFYFSNKLSDEKDPAEIWTIFIILIIPIAIIRVWIGTKIFKEEPTLVDKIMRCRLRMQYGRDYCAKCADSYTCASSIDKK
jgi:hypothetical protein